MRTQTSCQRFLVTTPGSSATRWLSFALATHPDVFVCHGKHPLHSVMHGRFDRERAQSDAGSFAQGNRMASFYRLLPLEEIFATYESISPNARARGNVHGFTIETIIGKAGNPAALDDIRIIDVLRHPINYIDSHTALVLNASACPDLRQDYQRQFSQTLSEIPELHLIDCPNFELFFAFAVSCKSVANLEKDFAHPQFERRRMESLTTALPALKEFCEFLTGLEYDEEPLLGMIQQGAINRHRPVGASNRPEQVFAQWQPWQQDMARIILSGSILRRLEECGYDVDLLKGAGKPAPAAPRTPAGPPRCLGDHLLTLSRATWPGQLRPARSVAHKIASSPPELVQEGFHGFNLVAYAGKYYALAQSLGPFDLYSADDPVLQAHQKDGKCIIADTLDRLEDLVIAGLPPTPYPSGNMLTFLKRRLRRARTVAPARTDRN